MKVNDKKRVIELTRAEAQKASIFGTAEYRDLQEVKRDYPRYNVKTIKISKRGDKFKGITKEYMRSYILKHDDEKHTVMDCMSVAEKALWRSKRKEAGRDRASTFNGFF